MSETTRQKLAGYLRLNSVRCLLLIMLGFGAHFPALQGTLIWDDEFLARDNPFIKSPLLILETFRHYLFPEASTHYRPVQAISYLFDYTIWNTNSYGFHLTNVLLHVGSAVLLYFLLRRLLPSLRRSGSSTDDSLGKDAHPLSTTAFFIALLWVVHPVHNAAVDYISGRADSLAFLFACGAWLLYLRATRSANSLGRIAAGTGALALLLLALCSRESALIWVGLFLLHLLFFEKKTALRFKLLPLVACLLVVGAYAGLRHLPAGKAATPSPTADDSAGSIRAVLMLRALGDYGRLMVFPSNLHMERTVESPDIAAFGVTGWRSAIATEYLSIAGLLVAALMAIGAMRKGPAQPIRILGAAWFFIAYLPISNLINLNATVAEHWLYLPSVGFLLFVAGCCLDLPARSRKFIAAGACFAVIGLGARSYVRSGDWVSSESLYRQTIGSGGTKIRVALNLSSVLVDRREYAKAETLLRRLVQMSPDYPPARNSLANVLFLQGKKKEAEELFASASKAAEKSRTEYPRTWIAALNVAHMCYDKKDSAGAIAVLDKARADYPGTWQLVSFESEVLRATKGPDAALPLIADFTKQNWWHAGASIALGRLYLEKGDLNQADAAFRHASWLDIHDAESVSLMTSIRVQENRLEEARTNQLRAIARQPSEPRQLLILSDVLSKMGRTQEASAMLARVTEMQAFAQAGPVAN